MDQVLGRGSCHLCSSMTPSLGLSRQTLSVSGEHSLGPGQFLLHSRWQLGLASHSDPGLNLSLTLRNRSSPLASSFSGELEVSVLDCTRKTHPIPTAWAALPSSGHVWNCMSPQVDSQNLWGTLPRPLA